MRIDLAMQPIVLPLSGRAMSYEILARRVDPWTGRVTMPIELARGDDCAGWHHIDLAVLSKLNNSLDELPVDAGLNINISPETVVSPDYWQRYCALLDQLVRARAAPVVVELSERIDLPDSYLFHLIRSLRELGAWIALDDLGAEYSSYSRLAYHKWDVCKIDYRPHVRSQVDGFIETTITRCRNRNVLTVLEGIETSEDVLMARGMGVDRCQGYAHGRPFLLTPRSQQAAYASDGSAAL